MGFLQDKKILFIAPSFHGLQNKIYEEMISQGAKVDYFDERPKNDFLTKVAIRLKLKLFTLRKIKKYYTNILNKTSNIKYDYVFIINLEAMTETILLEFKKQQKEATFILYMWDSLELKTISDTMLALFDKKFTFDYRDAEKRNMILHHLFYSKEYTYIPSSNIEFDLCFIGTAHGDRYKLLEEIKEKALKMNLKVYYYLYMPSKVLFFLRKILDKNLHKAKISDINFESLNSTQIAKIMNKSKVIIDLSYKNQKGLSMRTFETLGVRKKLLTTHTEVKKYDFYYPDNFYLINKEDIKLDKEFFNSEYIHLEDCIYEKYSISAWLKKIFMGLDPKDR